MLRDMTGRIPRPPLARTRLTARRSSHIAAGVCMSIIVALALTANASALTPSQIGKCLDLSGRSALRLAHVDDGLGLTREQITEAKQRVADFWRGHTAAWNLDGLGFTPEQDATFTQRVNAMIARSSWPIGSPCPKFKNRAKVVSEVKKLLIYNGYRPAMKVTYTSPRQIMIDAILDGYRYFVTVVKIAPRTVLVSSQPVPTSAGGGGSVKLMLKFDA